jgi:DNA-binding GntR family transcriptional regulator
VVDFSGVDPDRIEPLYEQIAAAIRSAVTSGEVRPGYRLPSESSIVQASGVSRLTARRAVQLLASEGLVTVVQGRGTFVTG